jgi:WXG100 family type VII secretion target
MDISQVDHESLAYFASQLEKECQEVVYLRDQTRNLVDNLAYSGWSGMGADRFYAEMYEVVLPALSRLYEALSDSALTARKVTILFQQAEQEAANNFGLVAPHSHQSI